MRYTPRECLAHYGALLFALGFTIINTSPMFFPDIRVTIASVLVGVACYVFGMRGVGSHTYRTCALCADRSPYLLGRLARLEDKAKIRRRLRLQHSQWCFAVVLVYGALAVAIIRFPDGDLAIPFSVVAAAFWWGIAWQIHHRHFLNHCSWCIRREVRRHRRRLRRLANRHQRHQRWAGWHRRFWRGRHASMIHRNPPDQQQSHDT